jgi:PD-(D/E)XK endonuclease
MYERLTASDLPGVSFLTQEALISVDVEQDDPPETRAQKRNTKLKGDISELRVAAALIEAGYAVSKPFGENQRYDLVIDDGETLARVQVKTGRLRNGVVLFNCSSAHGHRGRPSRPYRGEVEYIAVYCPDTGKVYVVPEAHFTNSYGSLRIVPTKNNVAKTVRWASAFELA